MLLAFDVGNSNMAIGAFVGDRLAATWRLPTRRETTADELLVQIATLLSLAGFGRGDVSAVAVASVVPPLTPVVREVARRGFGADCLVVEASTCGLPIRYHPADAVGADRLVNAVAAMDLVGAPAVVVDFGTATTVDAVSPAGEYAGGAIAPGPQVSLAALSSAAALLPRVALARPATALGQNTADSVSAGLFYGHAGLVDRLVEEVLASLGTTAPVIATGGLADLIVPLCRSVSRVEPHLTLHGINLTFRRKARAHDWQ